MAHTQAQMKKMKVDHERELKSLKMESDYRYQVRAEIQKQQDKVKNLTTQNLLLLNEVISEKGDLVPRNELETLQYEMCLLKSRNQFLESQFEGKQREIQSLTSQFQVLCTHVTH